MALSARRGRYKHLSFSFSPVTIVLHFSLMLPYLVTTYLEAEMNLLYKAATLAVRRFILLLLLLRVVPFAKDVKVPTFATTFLLPFFSSSLAESIFSATFLYVWIVLSLTMKELLFDRLAKRPGIPNDLSRNNLSRSWSSPEDQSIHVTAFRFPQRALGGRD